FQRNSVPSIGFPLASRATAANCTVAPGAVTVAVLGVTVTRATGRESTGDPPTQASEHSHAREARSVGPRMDLLHDVHGHSAPAGALTIAPFSDVVAAPTVSGPIRSEATVVVPACAQRGEPDPRRSHHWRGRRPAPSDGTVAELAISIGPPAVDNSFDSETTVMLPPGAQVRETHAARRRHERGRRPGGRGSVAELAFHVIAPAIRYAGRGHSARVGHPCGHRRHRHRGQLGFRPVAEQATDPPTVRRPVRRERARMLAAWTNGHKPDPRRQRHEYGDRTRNQRPITELPRDVAPPAVGGLRHGY